MKTTICLASESLARDLPAIVRASTPLSPRVDPLSYPIDPSELFVSCPWPERSRSQSVSEGIRPTSPECPTQQEELRHILLGSPGAVQQTIYLLHSLHYRQLLQTATFSPHAEQAEQ